MADRAGQGRVQRADPSTSIEDFVPRGEVGPSFQICNHFLSLSLSSWLRTSFWLMALHFFPGLLDSSQPYGAFGRFPPNSLGTPEPLMVAKRAAAQF